MVDWWFALVVWIPGMSIQKWIVTWGRLKRRSNLMQMIWDNFEVFVRRLLKRWKGFMPPLKKLQEVFLPADVWRKWWYFF